MCAPCFCLTHFFVFCPFRECSALLRAERTSTRASTRAEACAEGSVAQEAFQKFVRSNRSCVERRQGQKTGTVLPTANHVDALLLNKEVCDNHEYYYGIVSTILGATAAKGAVHCHQQTGRASMPNGSWEETIPFRTDSSVRSRV